MLEVIYATNTVPHIISGKAYSRALRGHTLVVSALLKLVLCPYLDTLSSEEINQLILVSNSMNMSTLADEACVRSLLAWFRDRKTELKAKSRTGSLWMSYIAYISVLLDFIRSERSSDWLLHLSATKRMLNLFATTGHNNYAKSCRLYYQSALNLEEEFPLIYEEFMKGNHTVRRTAKN